MGSKVSVVPEYQQLTLLDEIKNTFDTDELIITTDRGTPVLELHVHSIYPPRSMCLLRVDSSYRAVCMRLDKGSESEAYLSGRLSTGQDFQLVLRTTGMTEWAQQRFFCCCYYYVGISFIEMKREAVYVLPKPKSQLPSSLLETSEHEK